MFPRSQRAAEIPGRIRSFREEKTRRTRTGGSTQGSQSKQTLKISQKSQIHKGLMTDFGCIMMFAEICFLESIKK